VPLIISLAKPLSMTLWMKTKMTLMSWMMKTRTASSMTRYDPLTYLDVTHWLIPIKDSDSEVELPRRRGPPKGRGGSSAGAVNPEECKQQ
jgi:hypothetical protein